jgi:hypothetical protein
MSAWRNVVGLAALSVLLAAAAFAVARYWEAAEPAYARLPAPVACDLRAGPCTRALGEYRLSLAISPPEIPLMTTLTLRVETDSPDVRQVVVEIRGLNMDMGLNRTRLQPDQDGGWVGETILPLCSQRRMEWEAAVQLDGVERFEVPFPFATNRR